MSKNKPKLILLDCNAIIHRAYHALPPLTNKKGDLVNAVYGFFTMFFKAIEDFKPDYIAAAFDLAGETFRHKEYKEYKAHRERADKELYKQFPIIQNILRDFNVPIVMLRGVEADDVIGSIAGKFDVESIIVTGDLDFLQVVDDNTFVYTMKRGLSNMILYDRKAVEQRLGFGPEHVTDFKGLKGDPSDNIPGVPGIGDKTATNLIRQFGAIENIYKKIDSGNAEIKDKVEEKLIENKDQAMMSKKLATIKRDIRLDFDLEKGKFGDYDLEKILNKFKDLGMNSLVKRAISLFGKKEMPLFANAVTKAEDKFIKEQINDYFKEGLFSKQIKDLELAIIPVIKEMEDNGIKIDVKKLESLSREIVLRIENITKKVYDFSGAEFNISSPQQLAEVLFDKLKIPTKDIKKTPKGVISTAASELEKLKNISPVVPLVLKYRELEKLRNTYIDALPKLVEDDGRIHTKFDQLGTSTGRISSSDPNLQNIPVRSEEGEEIRKAFIVEDGFKLVSFDYSQIDLRVAAHISDDKKLMEAFKKGEDIHSITAKEVFGKTSEKEVTTKMRRVAKMVNFGVLYGISSFGLSARSDISQSEAKEFIEKYFKKFSGVAEYIERAKKEAREKEFVQTIFGRKRYVKELQSKNWQIRASGERMAVNMPIQGTSADIVKMAMRDVWAWLIKNNYTKDIKILLQIHDELIFEVKKDLADKIIKDIKNIMENAAELKVPLVVDAKIGDNWGETENA